MVEPQRPVESTSTGAIRFASNDKSSSSETPKAAPAMPYVAYPNASNPGAQARVSRA